jgi:hypothetical protein
VWIAVTAHHHHLLWGNNSSSNNSNIIMSVLLLSSCLKLFNLSNNNSIVSFQYRIVVRKDDLRIVAFAREFMAVNISTSTFSANRCLSFVQVWHYDHSIEEKNDE